MVKDKKHPTDDLTAFFEAARSATPQPTPDLKMRILADADRLQKAGKVSRKRNWFDDLKDWFHDLGGAPSALGFASSLVAGVYIGFSHQIGQSQLRPFCKWMCSKNWNL